LLEEARVIALVRAGEDDVFGAGLRYRAATDLSGQAGPGYPYRRCSHRGYYDLYI